MAAQTIKPEHAAVKVYYATLKNYADLKAIHEGATETAFSHLLQTTCRTHKWHLIPKQSYKLPGGKSVVPDGTLWDEFNLRRGFWEAKDESDDLDDEIIKKIAKKYPLTNTIFEDTRTALLSQSGVFNSMAVIRFDVTQGKAC